MGKRTGELQPLTKGGPPRLDLSGKRFGRLVALSPVGRDMKRQTVWAARCDCGAQTEVTGSSMKNGHTRSCGCLEAETKPPAAPRTHGMTRSTTYYVYQGMLQRCYNDKAPSFARYGGRGITVCDRWRESFEAFLADMGVRPAGKTLDRYPDQAGNYSPENCRWATAREQRLNQSNVRLIEHAGRTMCIADWAKAKGIHEDTLRLRLKRGWSVAVALGEAHP